MHIMLQRHCLPADDSMDPLVFLSENLSVSLSVCLSLSRERVRARTHTHKYTHPHPHILRSNKQVVILLHAHMRLACTSIDLFFLLPYSLFIFIFDNPVALRFIRVDMLSTMSILSSETKIHTHTHNFFPFYFPCLELLCPEKMGLLSAHPLLACLPSCSLILFALVCVCVCVCVCMCVCECVCTCPSMRLPSESHAQAVASQRKKKTSQHVQSSELQNCM